MKRSAALLVALVVATVGVAVLVPLSLRLSSTAETDATELQHTVLSTRAAVHAQVAAGLGMLDALDAVLDGAAQAEPGLVENLVTRIGDEAQTWNRSTQALDEAGVEHLDDGVAAGRDRVNDLVNELSEMFVAIGPDAVEISDEMTATREAIETLRDDYAVLDEAVDVELVRPQLARITDATGQLRTVLLVGLGSLLAFLLGAIVVVLRTSRRASRESARRNAERTRAAKRSEFESSLMRGLEMAKTEEAVFDLVRQAIDEGAPGHPAEILVADSSRAHLRQAVAVGGLESGCAVVSPLDCPASNRGQTAVFADDSSIDTCPHLRGRGVSAACVPVSVAGKTTGVVHVTGTVGAPPEEDVLVAVEIVAHRASERLAMVRAFEQTSAQANTDALTGLANRRALEHRLRELQRGGIAYSLAFCDLDRFKQLNDHHGHEAGDRALRLFARVLRDTVRPTDLPSRYGGEEFVLLLPECGEDESYDVLERVRARLADAVGGGSVPAFTCSFGLATSDDGELPEDVINAADGALLAAKAAGRDRIVRVSEPPPTPPPAEITRPVPLSA